MQINSTPTKNNAAPSAAPREALGASKEKMRFLLNLCKRRPWAKPILMQDEAGGHFLTTRAFEGVVDQLIAQG
jgi:hypothetical protein